MGIMHTGRMLFLVCFCRFGIVIIIVRVVAIVVCRGSPPPLNKYHAFSVTARIRFGIASNVPAPPAIPVAYIVAVD
ncbi:uncharacterized protein ASPGLDRAFT_374535 [Aspergillus glaucus CBS 516.65]|uniref:Uncharacterized protein n=1 Tax=Aspergillus glaucus CBS 516.65 TaxID=1160497 RepID=A0A1L9VJC0_ASPGL|nr:hypothetical protein ASPGLDRAFT_374535 [Aspergillus glaucus CBS 516.65]OJJ84021.1 hypothetical protein ASPGLDRAFT_374535 [Aspergillus glaucus CBS 516.65]